MLLGQCFKWCQWVSVLSGMSTDGDKDGRKWTVCLNVDSIEPNWKVIDESGRSFEPNNNNNMVK